MQLFYTPDIEGEEYDLPREESQHAARVLRMKAGDEITLTDGKGSLYHCHMKSVSDRSCRVKVDSVEQEYGKLPYRLVMAVAPTKNIDRYEWFLEKATETGVGEFIPILSAHSERKVIKLEREQKVITAAVKQSLKAYHPLLSDMTQFSKVVRSGFPGRKFIAHCDESLVGKKYLPSCISKGEDALILIGPEGDFSKEEIQLALECGFEEITLGPQRFRTETAALAAVMMVNFVNSL